ncbi:glycosyltransferase [Candidatus Micrarchaeota archaeon]|nr:glycosyltransferase [Candidatus Micrarchaeota archaeon]
MKQKISIVLPLHNERENAERIINEITSICKKQQWDYEIVPVDDCSKDETPNILKRLSGLDAHIQPVYRTGNSGVGRALRAGFDSAKGEIIVTMDGDFSHVPEQIPELVDGLSEADIVVGSRYCPDGAMDSDFTRILISKSYNTLAKLLYGLKVGDVTTGFRAHKKKVLDKIALRGEGFEIHPEIPIKAFRKGFKIVEKPIHYEKRKGGSSKLRYLKVMNGYLSVLFKNLL